LKCAQVDSDTHVNKKIIFNFLKIKKKVILYSLSSFFLFHKKKKSNKTKAFFIFIMANNKPKPNPKGCATNVFCDYEDAKVL